MGDMWPGVYVKEIPGGARPIEAVGTSTAAFVAEAPRPTDKAEGAVAINNWTQFVTHFAGDSKAENPLANAVYGFFQNGGSRCYVVNSSSVIEGLKPLERIDDVAIVCAPGATDAASYDAVLTHCENLKDRVAILDGPAKVDDVEMLTRVLPGDAPAPVDAGDAGGKKKKGTPGAGAAVGKPRPSDGGYGAVYYPWLNIRNPLDSSKPIQAAPSGHVAGIYARCDALVGVHKAPANAIVNGATGVSQSLTNSEHAILNGAAVNAIRFNSTRGIRVMGARTLAGAASEWRYINVRRLFAMVEESIGRDTQWVIFEPNDLNLWKLLKRDLDAFLTRIWRAGALQGATPEEAFFVKCDEETNPQERIDAGEVNAVIALAPVKPAEFVILQFTQGMNGASVQEG